MSCTSHMSCFTDVCLAYIRSRTHSNAQHEPHGQRASVALTSSTVSAHQVQWYKNIHICTYYVSGAHHMHAWYIQHERCKVWSVALHMSAASHLVLHEIGDIIKGEGYTGVIIQQEAVTRSCVVIDHELLHAPQHLMAHRLSAIPVIPVHRAAQHHALRTSISICLA